MNLFSWTSWIRQHARILLKAAGAEMASVLLTVLTAWECTNILNGLFLSSFHSLKETAPDFLVLFLALVFKALSNHYRQKNVCVWQRTCSISAVSTFTGTFCVSR